MQALFRHGRLAQEEGFFRWSLAVTWMGAQLHAESIEGHEDIKERGKLRMGVAIIIVTLVNGRYDLVMKKSRWAQTKSMLDA